MLRMTTTVMTVVLMLAGGGWQARASTLAQVIVEGVFDDWSDVPVAFVDPTGDHGASVADIGAVRLSNDEDYVHVRFEVGALMNLQTITGPLRIYFDVDRSSATGWPVGNIGSDFVLLFPERHGAEQTSSSFQAAGMSHALVSLTSGPTVAGTEFELRIRRDAIFPIRGTPVFADVNPSTLLIDPASAESLIGERTRAIVAVETGASASANEVAANDVFIAGYLRRSGPHGLPGPRERVGPRGGSSSPRSGPSSPWRKSDRVETGSFPPALR